MLKGSKSQIKVFYFLFFLFIQEKISKFASLILNGHVAKRLGSGLQNHLQRFESARDL